MMKQKLISLLTIYEQKGLKPILGYEIEFYAREPLGIEVQKEKGKDQYEINKGPFDNVWECIESIERDRILLKAAGADLSPKPFKDDYGSSMHLHLNLLDNNQNNLFDRGAFLDFAANGLCQYINKTLKLILPYEEDYARLDDKFMAPTKVCYGNNNRSVAVRIPGTKPIRLEYRVCSNNTDPTTAMFIVLKSVLLGLESKYKYHFKVFGNAFDDQYDLESIAKSLSEAERLFDRNFFEKL
ncbi:glutamine synthetase [Candidatus Phycorickettsia trachydisci]|uniref:Glutamine synthetase n=1 Tax=Candidatus Phycorickettsia trachydisci TaxID=2115978 RepID=A0A2P1P8L6_9RICK|nr:glutamine synthetase [Candidatus Phycorickettsia trachydisci]AVP87620.1 glutamine synthetase [Candidatus Phycorickettsia trachydisci]